MTMLRVFEFWTFLLAVAVVWLFWRNSGKDGTKVSQHRPRRFAQERFQSNNQSRPITFGLRLRPPQSGSGVVPPDLSPAVKRMMDDSKEYLERYYGHGDPDPLNPDRIWANWNKPK